MSGELWATNNGRDGMGDDIPPETINLVSQGTDFGWPRCHAGDIPDPDLAGDRGCEGVAPPAVEMQAHSAPLGLRFYDHDALGTAYSGSLLVAFHGSWNRSEPTGYKVVVIPFADGRPVGEPIDFATGWLQDNGEYWGRPVDVLVAPDGSLFVSDDFGGRIFRIAPAG
jgi:glucose/arabinose dehydrogenase